MDKADLESRHGLLASDTRLRPLLCRGNGEAAAGNGATALYERLCGDTARGRAGLALTLAHPLAHLRQQHVRPLPFAGSRCVAAASVRGHAPGALAHAP